MVGCSGTHLDSGDNSHRFYHHVCLHCEALSTYGKLSGSDYCAGRRQRRAVREQRRDAHSAERL